MADLSVPLAPGMTVQVGNRAHRRVAYCVRCGWTSGNTTYDNARAIASRPDSHVCRTSGRPSVRRRVS